ncbi:hypothetical protein F3K44_31180 [Bacillus megaterium]|nr:hypothetical protein [Priestia megaterium]
MLWGITKSEYLSAASHGYNFNNFTYCSRRDQLFYTAIADSTESMYNDRLQPIRQLGQIHYK